MTNILAKFKRTSDLFEKRQNGSKTSRLSCSNPKSLKCPPTQSSLMLKITILGLVLVAIVLSVAVPATIADTIQADEIMSSASISGEPLRGPLPEVRISDLPEIGETAIVTVTYTNEFIIDVTDTEAQNDYYWTGWRISPGFKVINSSGVTLEPYYPEGADELYSYDYLVPTALNSGESVTYTFEVLAIKEGTNFIGGLGYNHVEAYIHVYLDDDNTMLSSEHMAQNRGLYERSVKSQSEIDLEMKAEHLRQLAEAIKNPPPNIGRTVEGDELIEFTIMRVIEEGFTVEEAFNDMQGNIALDLDVIRRVLIGAGFSEDEIDSALPTDDAPVSKSNHDLASITSEPLAPIVVGLGVVIFGLVVERILVYAKK